MRMRTALRLSVLVVAITAALSIAWTVDVQAQGVPQGSQPMTPGTGGMQQEVRGMIKDLDLTRKTLTLDDGTKLSLAPGVQLPQDIKEGSIVKASYEEHAGQKVVTALEVQIP